MNASVATMPICGWVLPNNLDGSLLVYDNQGKVVPAQVTSADTGAVLKQPEL